MKVKAAVLRECGKPLPYVNSHPLSIEEVELDPPQSGEVLAVSYTHLTLPTILLV